MAVHLFAALFFAGVLIGVPQNILSNGAVRSQSAEVFAMLGEYRVFILTFTRFAFAAWVGWMVYFRASRVGVVLAALLVVGRVFQLPAALLLAMELHLSAALWTVQFVLQFAALAMLLLPEARRWLANRGRAHSADVFE